MTKNLFKLLTPVVNVLNLYFLAPDDLADNSLGLAPALFVPVLQGANTLAYLASLSVITKKPF
jgi:hypothetical protein